ncbi:MAG: hypothetical protein ACLUD2_18015 [Clostridium sp.]
MIFGKSIFWVLEPVTMPPRLKQPTQMYLPVEAEVMIPTVFTNHAKINQNCIYNQDEILVVGISQSGTSVSTIEAMKKAKQEGYYTVAITEATEV